MKKSTLQVISIAILLFTSASCKKEKSNVSGTSNVMFVNAASSTFGSSIDIGFGGALPATGLMFGSNTPYSTITAGTYDMSIYPEGTTTALSVTNETLSADKTYTVFAVDDPAGVKPVVVQDSLGTPVTGTANLRYFNLSEDAPAVDVAIAGGAVLFSARSFDDEVNSPSLENFATIAPGTYNFEIRQTGTTNVLYTLNSVVINDAKDYTLISKGLVAGNNAQSFGAEVIANN